MGDYKSQYPPAISIDKDYKQFFEDFYACSDDPDAHERYTTFFTEDADLTMASKHVKGTAAILALRKSLWEKVSGRKHTPVKIFPFGPDAHEVMLYGQVSYALKSGGSTSLDWAAHAVLTKEDGAVKMSFYQVYLDTAQQAK